MIFTTRNKDIKIYSKDWFLCLLRDKKQYDDVMTRKKLLIKCNLRKKQKMQIKNNFSFFFSQMS